MAVSSFLSGVMARPIPSDSEALDGEISEVCYFLNNTALELIPAKGCKKITIFLFCDRSVKTARLYGGAGLTKAGHVRDRSMSH